MHVYNSKHGWTAGDDLLKKFATKLESYMKNERIFRVYGDDFITLNHEHVVIDLDEINQWDILKNSGVTVSNYHYNLKNQKILTLNALEKIFFLKK